MKIAFLDSGVGGLTILESFQKYHTLHEHCDVLYLADTVNLPYGNKSLETLYNILIANLNWLYEQEVDYLILACNTNSALLDSTIKAKYPNMTIYSLLDYIDLLPVENINQHITVFATYATCATNIYLKRLQEKFPNVEQIACPELVPHIENFLKNPNIPEASTYIQKYINQSTVNSDNINYYIYGCSHYPYVHNTFQRYLPQAYAINPGDILAQNFKHFDRVLDSIEPLQFQCYTTSDTDLFATKLQLLSNNLNCVQYFSNQIELAQIFSRSV